MNLEDYEDTKNYTSYVVVEFETTGGAVKRQKHPIPKVWEIVTELLFEGHVVTLEKGEVK